ncbi:hypothetical protein [Halopelagius fulvigenes]|uniref:Uncharacterized protein n=1 Tax=Halopelagius fulvigenes TaxID=1198324 RepID=A0ABD5TVB5_9EURY
MYDKVFDTDWRTLEAEDALRRMYALGIASELGHEFPEERTRIRRLTSTAYQRSVLDLAYNEGRRQVQDVRGDFDADSDLWDALIDEDGSPKAPPTLDVDRTPAGLPKAVSRASMLELDVDELEMLRIPSLLRRDE